MGKEKNNPIPLIVWAIMGLAGIFGGVWLVRELKEPPAWLSDWDTFIKSPAGIMSASALGLGGLALLFPYIEKLKK